MDHSLFAVFPLPVVLAFALLVLLLLAMTRVLTQLCKPVPVRHPACASQALSAQAAQELS